MRRLPTRTSRPDSHFSRNVGICLGQGLHQQRVFRFATRARDMAIRIDQPSMAELIEETVKGRRRDLQSSRSFLRTGVALIDEEAQIGIPTRMGKSADDNQKIVYAGTGRIRRKESAKRIDNARPDFCRWDSEIVHATVLTLRGHKTRLPKLSKVFAPRSGAELQSFGNLNDTRKIIRLNEQTKKLQPFRVVQCRANLPEITLPHLIRQSQNSMNALPLFAKSGSGIFSERALMASDWPSDPLITTPTKNG